MSANDCKFSKTHEWIKVSGKHAVMGVSEYAAKQLGDVVFVQMPEPGTKVEKGKTLGVIESVKTVSDLYAPVSGKVTKKNADLESSPELVNQDPYGKGWICEIEMSSPNETGDLLDAKAYDEHCAHSGH